MANQLPRFYSITLANGAEQKIYGKGDRIVCPAATANFQIAVDDGGFGTMREGMRIKMPENFTELTVKNNSGASYAIEIYISGEIEVDTVLPAQETSPPVLNSVDDVSLANAAKTSIIDLPADCKEVFIKNLDGSASVRVGDTNITASRGHELGPGDTIIMTLKDAEVFGRNDSGAAVTVSVIYTSES